MGNELNKMTAVEWLMEEMSKTYIFNQDDFDMFKQAKQMEKEQIKDACKKGYGSTAIYRNKLSEQYYAETYGKTFIDLVSDEESKVHEVVRKLKGGNK